MSELDRSIERLAAQLERVQGEMQRAGLLPGKPMRMPERPRFGLYWQQFREYLSVVVRHPGHVLVHAPRPD